MHDDCLHEDDDVKEALRRLPEKLLHERNYRIVRALQLGVTHDILPKDEWTKFEDVSYPGNNYVGHHPYIVYSLCPKGSGTDDEVPKNSSFLINLPLIFR